jgi:hypothetical protein
VDERHEEITDLEHARDGVIRGPRSWSQNRSRFTVNLAASLVGPKRSFAS